MAMHGLGYLAANLIPALLSNIGIDVAFAALKEAGKGLPKEGLTKVVKTVEDYWEDGKKNEEGRGELLMLALRMKAGRGLNAVVDAKSPGYTEEVEERKKDQNIRYPKLIRLTDNALHSPGGGVDREDDQTALFTLTIREVKTFYKLVEGYRESPEGEAPKVNLLAVQDEQIRALRELLDRPEEELGTLIKMTTKRQFSAGLAKLRRLVASMSEPTREFVASGLPHAQKWLAEEDARLDARWNAIPVIPPTPSLGERFRNWKRRTP